MTHFEKRLIVLYQDQPIKKDNSKQIQRVIDYATYGILAIFTAYFGGHLIALVIR